MVGELPDWQKLAIKYALITVCFPCFCWIRLFPPTCRKRVPRQSKPTPRRRAPPSKPRIDIFQRPAAVQSHKSAFFRLPLELRLRIYEDLLGRRIFRLRAVHNGGIAGVRSQYLEPVAADPHSRWEGVTEGPTTAILLSCRHTYHEALPVLYGQNTFSCSILELHLYVLTGIGKWSLPYIRSLDLTHSFRCSYIPPWHTVFALLERMNLKRLMFRFGMTNGVKWTAFNPRVDTVNDTWAYRVLGFRNLQFFELFMFESRAFELYVQDYSGHSDIAREMQRLLIGPGAEERYREYLEKWEENHIVYVADPYLHV
ncbi:hypothetical protein R3P38DRAFT_2698102 [Favolaschia claudopus]|uniref:DUF7730 domain-containing protein n=1 Tax=Favolaschia claudopus TaxID=2862362 RepID=A0AAW0CDV6_9AGAR